MPTPLHPPGAAPAATLKLKRTPEIGQPDPRVTPIPVRPESPFPRVAGYDILSVVGYGGMGIVYEARHRELNRRVAIKMLRGEALTDPEYRERLRVEAEAIARLQHPNVIQVFEVGTVEAQSGDLYPNPFLALEFIDGGSLAQHTYSPQPPHRAAETVETLARAAHAAHQLGVVHRDLKPANVLLTRDGTPKIADFGIAKRIDEGEAARGLTRDGVVMGTPEYMAPEQLHGQTASPTIDVYALGVILYELLTGRVPFQGASFADTMLLTMYQEPVPPRRLQPAVPRDVETICLKCLEKNPAKRYATAADLADDLAAWADGRPIRARALGPTGRAARWARRNPAVAALSALAVLLALGGVGGVLWEWRMAEVSKELARTREGEARENAVRAEGAAAEARRNAARERWERYRISVFAASSALRLHDTTSARTALDAAPPDHRDWVWHLLRAQLDRSGAAWSVGLGHGITFSADGRRALTNDTRTGRACRVDLHAGGAVLSHALPAGWHLAWLSRDGSAAAFAYAAELRVYDTDPWRPRPGFGGHTGPVRLIDFSADGAEVLTAADDGTARRWDARTGAARRAVRLRDALREPMAVDPAWRTIAACAPDGPALWDADTGRERARLRGHTGDIRRFVFRPDGARLVSVEEYPTNTLRLWDAATGRLLATLDGHENTVQHVAFSSDGERLVSCGLDRTVRLWDLSAVPADGRLKAQRVWREHTDRVDWVAFRADGRRVVSAAADRTLRYWDVGSDVPIAVLQGHDNWVTGAVFDADGKNIVSVSNDSTARAWDVAELEADYALRGHTKFVYGVAFRPDGRRVASAAWDGTARVWDPTTRAELTVLRHSETGEGRVVSSVAYHPSGRYLATLCRDQFVRLWDADSGTELHRWAVRTGGWCDGRLVFSPDGALLAVGSTDHKVHLLDVERRTVAGTLEGHMGPVRDVAFSPDGKRLASGSEFSDRAVRVWDVATRKQLQVLTGHQGASYTVAWHPDGRLLASAGTDDTVRLWDTATGEPIGEPLKQGANAFAVCFSPDGKLLAVGCADNLIRVWHVETRDVLAELSGHASYVHSLAFSPDGTRLVSGSGDHSVRVWDTVPPRERRR